MKQSGIYKITINDKSYVGLSADIVRRTKTHRNSFQNNTHGNRHLQRAYNKYKDFQLEILEKCEDWIEEKETMWIEKLDTYKSGFNQDEGGGGGASPTRIQKENECCKNWCANPYRRKQKEVEYFAHRRLKS